MKKNWLQKKINSAWSRIEEFVFSPHFNLLKTLYFNFRVLPFKNAIKLPVYIYGPIRLLNLHGCIEIKSEIKSGMIKIGRWYDRFYGPRGSSFIFMPGKSKIIFYGKVEIGIDVAIRLGENGVVELGNMVAITSGVKLAANNLIKIGDFSRITWNCRLVDTDYHFTWDCESKEVFPNTKPIIIGKYNWIGNNSAINKGAVTSDFTIVASGSIVNKNFLKVNDNVDQPLLLAGAPAQIVKRNKKRLYSRKYEQIISNFFKQGNEAPYHLPVNFIDDYNSIQL